MLPKIATPNAPPISAHVSEMPDAEPARSGGAEPIMTSFASVNTGDEPKERISDANANSHRSSRVGPSRANMKKPADDSRSPQKIRCTGRMRRDNGGVANEPRMKPIAQGTLHSPPRNGERPSTS